MTAIRDLLSRYREASKTEREKGTYFERLCAEFLKSDPEMAQEFSDAWLYSEWAAKQGIDGKDVGIDVVAKLRDDDGFCAVQCKFYQQGHRIQKSDIDSFFTASGKKHFTRRLIIDTTEAPWSLNAEDALKEQSIETQRIGLDRLNESPINWAAFLADDRVILAPKKEPLQHQREAVRAVKDGLAAADRGKLVMACGTGKTYTALKIAEGMAGVGGRVLYLVPSLALMSQSIREWSLDAELELRSFAVCSDAQVGKRNTGKDDIGDIDIHDLAHPATTNAAKLAAKAAKPSSDRMTVVFATYQSIQVISDAQRKHDLPEFDLIICDEAHRTTGSTLFGDDESNFVKVHSQDFIASKKRIYMTATPRIFADSAKAKANENSIAVCSMDDPDLYGETLFQRGFGWAVQNGLLTDYKVIVLAVDEAMVSASIQNRLTDADSQLVLDDATKIIGCYKALTKADLAADVATDTGHMRRALAFCKDIASSKLIRDEFSAVVEEYLASMEGDEDQPTLKCELRHVDGTFNAKARTRELDWLKADHDDHAARVLTNARCLSEGVDVPALDAIMFMHPRKSQIDVVQSVGRVMRRAEGKKMGYVILPVGVPAGIEPEEALNSNERYRVVWQILNALRAHDERFDATINKMDLGVDVSSHIEVIAITSNLNARKEKNKKSANIGHGSAASDDERDDIGGQEEGYQPSFTFDEFSTAIMAKIVKKCGKRDYWEDWATDIAKIAQTHITRITAVVQQSGSSEREAFEQFLAEIRDDLNESITEAEAVEMLAQHIITKPVFEALFEGYSFTKNNPVSIAMQSVLDVLHEQNLEKEAESLQKFYASVKVRAAGIDNAAGKQKIVVELYDKFFRNAFPRMTEKLGIVYTPVEVVDFIIHSVNDVLRAEFGQTLGSKGVHILDPFTGTGTFITRLLQSGLIKPEELERKYGEEIHANEIVLLAYYIAAINIEAVYHSISGRDYKPFEGICLTDTFQLYEKDDLISGLLADNSSRRQRQKKLDIRVIVGNPPYSAGQKNENDNSANVEYPHLDARLGSTYSQSSQNKGGKRSLYDSYIRAIRWGSDRLGERGVLAYITGNAWIERAFADGMRKCVADEFSTIYVVNLRGDIRKDILSKGRAREGGNIFGSGSMTGNAITVFVKNPERTGPCSIHYLDIGDDLTGPDKLNRLIGLFSVGQQTLPWVEVQPNAQHDWIDQRDSSFENFISIGGKAAQGSSTVFSVSSFGVVTSRDAWCYNFSASALKKNVSSMIDFYNSEVDRFAATPGAADVDSFVNPDPSKISWGVNMKAGVKKGTRRSFQPNCVRRSLYRPFTKAWAYADKNFVHSMYSQSRLFPSSSAQNLAIVVAGVGARSGFSALMVDTLPNLDLIEKGQCFPLYSYADNEYSIGGLFDESADPEQGRSCAITDDCLALFQSTYASNPLTKEDIFFYLYGLLHSEEYRTRYASSLFKQLPRIPLVRKVADFWAYSKAGRQLSQLHVNFESAEPYPLTIEGGLSQNQFSGEDWRVEKMKFGGSASAKDRSKLVYNSKIAVTGIPLEAYDYLVGGKPALEWVMERQAVKTDKASQIINDANRYAVETIGDPAYPLKLFQRVITVSLETMKIVRSLPELDI